MVIDEFNRFTENNRMTRALIAWLGFKREYVYFNANERLDGVAKYNFLKLFRLAMGSFVSMSLLPLKLAGYLGVLIVFCSGALGLYILIGKYIFHFVGASSFSGPAQLAILIIFLVGIILMSLGLIALYIANIHGEVAGRPLYVIKKKKFYD
jgi:dolichol-phosphate mannosyltransferase